MKNVQPSRAPWDFNFLRQLRRECPKKTFAPLKDWSDGLGLSPGNSKPEVFPPNCVRQKSICLAIGCFDGDGLMCHSAKVTILQRPASGKRESPPSVKARLKRHPLLHQPARWIIPSATMLMKADDQDMFGFHPA